MLKVIESIDEILREISDETRNYADLFEILAPGQGSHKSKKRSFLHQYRAIWPVRVLRKFLVLTLVGCARGLSESHQHLLLWCLP